MHYPEVDFDVVQAASERGIAHASWMLSVLYRMGLACEKSDLKSMEYLKTAVAQGSMRAKRDLALRAHAGALPEIPQKRAYAMMVELVDAGFDAAGLGEKLILSGIPLLVCKGYEALKLSGYELGHFRSRHLTALYETFDGTIPDAREMQFFLTYNRCHRSESKSAHRALALADVIGVVGNSLQKPVHIAEKLLLVDSVDACIDANDILDLCEADETVIDLRMKASKQLEAHALGGHPQAQVLYTAELLYQANGSSKAPLALRLMELLGEHPQFYRNTYDSLIDGAKAEDTRIGPLHVELAQTLVDAGACPLAHRYLGIEFMRGNREDEALAHFLRAVELDVPYALKNVVSWYGQRFSKTGENYEDTRFWHEALMFESPQTGVELTNALLVLRKEKSLLTHKESLTRKTCLEILSEAGDEDSTRELGLLLLKGDGPVLAETRRGLALLEKAAQSDGRAMYELAHLYLSGVFVPKDLYLAQHYFAEAAKNGHSNAIYETVRAELKAEKETHPVQNNILKLAEPPLDGDSA